MAADILQRFLTKRLFDVGGDDARVTPLRDAAGDVAAVLKASPQRAATMTMVAIDSGIGPAEPLVGEVMAILEKHWQSYAGAFADTKLPTVARAILLHALTSTMGSEPIAAAVSLTARTMLPHLGDAGDRELWGDIVAEAEHRLALRAEREWALPSAAKALELTLTFGDLPALVPSQMSRDWLAERLAAAAGPHNVSGEAYKAPVNSHFPNAGAPWSYEFGPIAASSISNAVNAVTKEMSERITALLGAETLRSGVTDYVTATTNAMTRTAVGLERRTSLLWWKEALYSQAAQVSYRGLAPAVAAALAAVDASAQTGPFAPRMAEAMVRETLRSIDTTAMLEDNTLVAHGEAIAAITGPVRTTLNASYGAIHSEAGRTPLGALLFADGALTDETVASRLGLAPGLAMNAVDLGVWLFRDLQAAAATPAPAKRSRASKPS